MGTTAIIAAIDKELARLHEIRAVLIKQEKAARKGRKPAAAARLRRRANGKLSPAARARIAEAQRKRWAAARKENKQ